jgi:hypothetical protein
MRHIENPRKGKNQKRMKTEDFNAVYDALRNSVKHPEVKPLSGQLSDAESWKAN